MIKIVIGVLCICVLIYVFMSFLKKNKETIDLHDGKSFGSEELNINSNKHNYKEFTHTFWLYVEMPEDGTIIRADLTDISYVLQLKKESKLSLDVTTGQSPGNFITLESRNFKLQKWNHIGIVKNLNDIDLYIDGELVKTHEISTETDFQQTHGSGIYIGDYGASAEDKSWSKENARMHNYEFHSNALLQRDVVKSYESLKNSFQSNTESAQYSFNINLLKNKISLGEMTF